MIRARFLDLMLTMLGLNDRLRGYMFSFVTNLV